MITIPAHIIKKDNVALETTTVSFSVGNLFTFLPGQYVTITIPQIAKYEVREQFRDFSITSSPD